jgi:enterochelin esterase-like enzyme
MVTDVLPGGQPLRDAFGIGGAPASNAPAPAPVSAGSISIERLPSRARGRDVDLVIISPDGEPRVGLPVCLALHGRGNSARWFQELGLGQFLNAAVQGGVQPFVVAAVDGGDTYFVDKDPADDPQRMLTEELPRWLDQRQLSDVNTALGISMGSFGALNLQRRRRNLQAVAAISPALFRSWGDAQPRDAFRDEQHWQANEPLRHVDELVGVPLGVWCGTEDPFIGAARELIDKTKPQVATLSPGAHDVAYWQRVLPDVLHFIGSRVS